MTIVEQASLVAEYFADKENPDLFWGLQAGRRITTLPSDSYMLEEADGQGSDSERRQ